MVNETLLIESIPVLSPLLENVRSIILSLQWLAGGMFGLYLILIFLRWRETKIVSRVLKEIRDDIKDLSNNIRVVNDKVKKLEKKHK